MSWSNAEIEQLRRLSASGKLFYSEIAERMNNNPVNVRYMARRLKLPPSSRSRMGEWNRKHAHLREKVMTYFLTHSWEETRKRFSLTRSELKSLFTAGYRDPKFAHLRKDTRRKDEWTVEEMLFLLRHAGVREREWIAQKINRSCARNIKERMRSWNAATKHLNGMPLSWARQFWPADPLWNRLLTKAGPSGGEGIWRFQIIPWHECLRLSRMYPTPVEIRSGIRTMVRFQEFIHGLRSGAWIRRRLCAAIREK